MAFQIVWSEVPVKDIERAQKFYEAAFGLAGNGIVDDGTRKSSTLLNTEGGAGLSLTQIADFEPRDNGVLVYLMGQEPVEDTLQKIESAGGKITTPKTSMGNDAGFYAIFQDTEGNVLALYSME
ncbi:MAG: VOC family protein [Anaerolineae bacterium]|nr:VOC family protein [Anaerolineae bacterium]